MNLQLNLQSKYIDPKAESSHYVRVKEFMKKIPGQEVHYTPTIPSEQTRLLRAKLILEEALEIIQNGLGVRVEFKTSGGIRILVDVEPHEFYIKDDFNMVETVDGCCDLKVVTTGTLVSCGVYDAQPQVEVDYNNLDKFGPGHSINEAGKLIKPPGHQPPDIIGCLIAQGYQQ